MLIYRLLQCIWGLPQTLAGEICYLFNRKCFHFEHKGAIVTRWNSKSSLSLGMFLFVSDDSFFYYHECRDRYDADEFSKMLMVHEYGHTIQSLIFGPAYLLTIGIPYIVWSFWPPFVKKRAQEKVSYFSAYPERWANRLGEQVTGEASIGEPV